MTVNKVYITQCIIHNIWYITCTYRYTITLRMCFVLSKRHALSQKCDAGISTISCACTKLLCPRRTKSKSGFRSFALVCILSTYWCAQEEYITTYHRISPHITTVWQSSAILAWCGINHHNFSSQLISRFQAPGVSCHILFLLFECNFFVRIRRLQGLLNKNGLIQELTVVEPGSESHRENHDRRGLNSNQSNAKWPKH